MFSRHPYLLCMLIGSTLSFAAAIACSITLPETVVVRRAHSTSTAVAAGASEGALPEAGCGRYRLVCARGPGLALVLQCAVALYVLMDEDVSRSKPHARPFVSSETAIACAVLPAMVFHAHRRGGPRVLHC